MIIFLKILAILALVALNAFFVAAEYAAISARATRLRGAADTMSGRAARLIKTRLDLFLSSCQLGTSLAALGLGAIAAPAVGSLLAPLASLLHLSASVQGIAAFAASFILAVALQIVVGEQTPKNIAIEHADRLLCRSGHSAGDLHLCFLSGDMAAQLRHAWRSAPGRLRTSAPPRQRISPAHRRGIARPAHAGRRPRHHPQGKANLLANAFEFGQLKVRPDYDSPAGGGLPADRSAAGRDSPHRAAQRASRACPCATATSTTSSARFT